MEGAYSAGVPGNEVPRGLGWKAWTVDPIAAAFAATQANTHLVGVYLEAGTVITGIAVPVTVAGVTLTLAKVGIYNSQLQLVAESADNLAGFEAIGWVETPLTAPYTVPVSGLYYLASGYAGTTLPTVLNCQQTAALSTGLPAGISPRGVHAQVPTAGQGLPTPAVSQGTFSNIPCLIAY